MTSLVHQLRGAPKLASSYLVKGASILCLQNCLDSLESITSMLSVINKYQHLSYWAIEKMSDVLECSKYLVSTTAETHITWYNVIWKWGICYLYSSEWCFVLHGIISVTSSFLWSQYGLWNWEDVNLEGRLAREEMWCWGENVRSQEWKLSLSIFALTRLCYVHRVSRCYFRLRAWDDPFSICFHQFVFEYKTGTLHKAKVYNFPFLSLGGDLSCSFEF